MVHLSRFRALFSTIKNTPLKYLYLQVKNTLFSGHPGQIYTKWRVYIYIYIY